MALKINRIEVKTAQLERHQKRVTYNNMLLAGPEKRVAFKWWLISDSDGANLWICVNSADWRRCTATKRKTQLAEHQGCLRGSR